jgi:uncharacterized RDD family membrane protein YckC
MIRTDGALATQLAPMERAVAAPLLEVPVPKIVPQRTPQTAARPKLQTASDVNLARAIQPPLFPERSGAKVVGIADYAPAPPRVTRTKTASSSASKPGVRRSRPASDDQGQLPFLPPQAAKPRTLGTTVDSVIFCEAPVAAPVHRLVATALDVAMVLIGYGLLLMVFRILGGAFELNKTNALAFGGMLLVTALAYGASWVIAGTETAGMHWMRLRLTTFDGFPPEPRQRVLRFFGCCLSSCTVLGLLWALADEEGLTWQDHISRTFPTPVALDQQIFRRV